MKYQLRCLECGKAYPENEYVTKCINRCDSLLRTEYKEKKLEVVEGCQGLWKYINWLPIREADKRILENSSTFSTYMSTKLAEYLGLRRLVICLNAHYPRTGATMQTGTFKDIDAELSFQRIAGTKDNGKPFVLSSNGNIANSFIHYSDILGYPIILTATEDARLNRIWSFEKSNPYVTLISMEGKYDYYDAISLANELGENDNFMSEGGTLNVARRDGVGTIMLDATRFLGHLPDHYFQSLGSGPGAIAVYEASLRLIGDGRYGKRLPKIHASQNYPFAPMYDAWQKKSRRIDEKYQNESAKEIISQVYAQVLTNRYPAYSIKGGVFDALDATCGEFYSITNEEAKKAQVLFQELEGCNIVPAAGVTVASLLQAVEYGTVDKDDDILLNVTGGWNEGIRRQRFKIEPSITIDKDYDVNEVSKEVLNAGQNKTFKRID